MKNLLEGAKWPEIIAKRGKTENNHWPLLTNESCKLPKIIKKAARKGILGENKVKIPLEGAT